LNYGDSAFNYSPKISARHSVGDAPARRRKVYACLLNIVRAENDGDAYSNIQDTSKTAALLGRSPPSPGVQALLLAGQSAPCCFHSHEGGLGFLVFGSFRQEGAISSIITIKISQTHPR
jgi:hypothetical protein